MAVDTESLLIRLEATSEQLRREMRRAEQQIGNSSKRMEREIRRVDQSMDRLNKMAATLRRGLGALGMAVHGWRGEARLGRLGAVSPGMSSRGLAVVAR